MYYYLHVPHLKYNKAIVVISINRASADNVSLLPEKETRSERDD